MLKEDRHISCFISIKMLEFSDITNMYNLRLVFFYVCIFLY